MFTKRISVREARAHFSDLLGSVHYSQAAVIVERKGKPFAVVISPEQYQNLQKQQEAALGRLKQLAESHSDKSADQVMSQVTEEVEAVRRERYEQNHKNPKSSR